MSVLKYGLKEESEDIPSISEPKLNARSGLDAGNQLCRAEQVCDRKPDEAGALTLRWPELVHRDILTKTSKKKGFLSRLTNGLLRQGASRAP